MLQLNSDSSSTFSPHMNLARVYENGLYDDISPRLSYHFGSIALMERTPSDRSPLHYFLEASGCSSTTTTPSTGTLISKPAAEMIKEISMLEVEIIHLERYLLSLYRTSFENHLSTLSSTFKDQDSRSYSQCKTESPLQELIGHSSCREARDNVGMQRSGRVQHNPATSTCGRINNLISPSPPKGKSKRGSGLPRLADHLGGSLLNQIAKTPDKLSEEIVRCMTAIYCNLASSRLPDIGASVSSSPSLSSSNTLSPQDLHDNWSPLCSEETTEYPCQPEALKETNGPYARMVEISKISLDDERLNYVASMLQNFRSLVRHLEKVDPRKMNREEKLTFWINIHNALVMHAYLAYGIHHNRIRSTSLVLKAAYNVGGHSISAHVIQSSILGCRPRRSASGNGKESYLMYSLLCCSLAIHIEIILSDSNCFDLNSHCSLIQNMDSGYRQFSCQEQGVLVVADIPMPLITRSRLFIFLFVLGHPLIPRFEYTQQRIYLKRSILPNKSLFVLE